LEENNQLIHTIELKQIEELKKSDTNIKMIVSGHINEIQGFNTKIKEIEDQYKNQLINLTALNSNEISEINN
jgi:ribonuclease PH